MLNFSKIKVVLIYLSFLAVSFFCFSNISDSNNFFLKKKINLGLDLQGGSYLLLEVDSTPLQKRHIQSKVIPLKKKLIENNINASNFEKRLKDRELEKKLFFLLNGGISIPEFIVKKNYKYENSKIDLRFINLDNFYKKRDQFTDTEITN